MKLSKFLIIYSGSFALLAGLVFLAGWFFVSEELVTRQVEQQLISISEAEASHVREFLEAQKEKLIIVAKSQNIKNFLANSGQEVEFKEKAESELKDIKKNIDHFDEMFVLDSESNILINTQDGYTPPDIFKKFALNQETENKAYIHKLRFCYCVNEYVLDISSPVFGSDNKMIGTVVARLFLPNLADITKDLLGMENLGQIYLVSQDGLLLTPSSFLKDESKGVFSQQIDNKNFLNCQEDYSRNDHAHHNSISSYNDFRGEEILGTHEKIEEPGWCLLVELDKKEKIKRLNAQYFNLIILAYAIFIAVVIGLNLILASFLEAKILLRKKNNSKNKNK